MRPRPVTLSCSAPLATRLLILTTAGGGAVICAVGATGGHAWGLMAGVATTWGLFLSGLAEVYRRDQRAERATTRMAVAVRNL